MFGVTKITIHWVHNCRVEIENIHATSSCFFFSNHISELICNSYQLLRMKINIIAMLLFNERRKEIE